MRKMGDDFEDGEAEINVKCGSHLCGDKNPPGTFNGMYNKGQQKDLLLGNAIVKSEPLGLSQTSRSKPRCAECSHTTVYGSLFFS